MITHIDTALGRVRVWQSDDGLWNWKPEAFRYSRHAFGTGFRSLEDAVQNALDMCGPLMYP